MVGRVGKEGRERQLFARKWAATVSEEAADNGAGVEIAIWDPKRTSSMAHPTGAGGDGEHGLNKGSDR